MVALISMLASGASNRAQHSYPQRLPTLDPCSTAATVRLLRFSLDRLDTSVSWSFPLHAFHSELSARAAGFVSHMFTHALTVCTQGMILTD